MRFQHSIFHTLVLATLLTTAYGNMYWKFTIPNATSIFVKGEPMTIRWDIQLLESTWVGPFILDLQRKTGPGGYTVTEIVNMELANNGSYTWTPPLNTTSSYNNAYILSVSGLGISPPSDFSPEFKLVDPGTPTTTFFPGPTTQTPSQTPSQTTTTVFAPASPTSNSTSTVPSPSQSASLGNSATVGGAIGGALGGVVLIGLVVFAFVAGRKGWLVKKGQVPAENAVGDLEADNTWGKPELDNTAKQPELVEAEGAYWVRWSTRFAELPGTTPTIYEMPGDTRHP